MTAPAFEVADILRGQGKQFLERYGSGMDYQQLKAFSAIRNCRTAALGGHIDVCPKCRHESRNFNSCRNRSCPKCQGRARRRWISAREREVLDTPYFHVVFTVPKELNLLALNNQRAIYNLLFQAAARTTLEVAANPDRLGAEIGILSILHTWGQNLREHPHIHCVIPQGGISPDHTRWIQPRYRYFLPKKVLSLVFRGKFIAGLKRRPILPAFVGFPGRSFRMAAISVFRVEWGGTVTYLSNGGSVDARHSDERLPAACLHISEFSSNVEKFCRTLEANFL